MFSLNITTHHSIYMNISRWAYFFLLTLILFYFTRVCLKLLLRWCEFICFYRNLLCLLLPLVPIKVDTLCAFFVLNLCLIFCADLNTGQQMSRAGQYVFEWLHTVAVLRSFACKFCKKYLRLRFSVSNNEIYKNKTSKQDLLGFICSRICRCYTEHRKKRISLHMYPNMDCAVFYALANCGLL